MNDARLTLASRMVGIDIQRQLERYLHSDKPPTGESVAVLFHRFPWLSGLAAVDANGMVLAQEPPAAMKELDFAKMLEQKARGNELQGLRGLVEDTPLGPEVLTGIPIYSGSRMLGLWLILTCGRCSYTSGAEDLVVLAPQGFCGQGHLDGTFPRDAADCVCDAFGRAFPRTARAVGCVIPPGGLQFSGHDGSGHGIPCHRRRGQQHSDSAASPH